MSIKLDQLFVYTQSTPNSLNHFVEFWAERYYDPYELLYTKNIRGPHTPEGLLELFKWKIGNKLFASKRELLERSFISRRDEAQRLLRDLSKHEFRAIASGFLDHFQDGGPIWRIFWLHCWDARFPIYDQHVHRAMVYIEEKGLEELSRHSPEKRIQLYLDRYLPFFQHFRGMDGRNVDQALWRFGKSLKDLSLPPPGRMRGKPRTPTRQREPNEGKV